MDGADGLERSLPLPARSAAALAVGGGARRVADVQVPQARRRVRRRPPAAALRPRGRRPAKRRADHQPRPLSRSPHRPAARRAVLLAVALRRLHRRGLDRGPPRTARQPPRRRCRAPVSRARRERRRAHRRRRRAEQPRRRRSGGPPARLGGQGVRAEDPRAGHAPRPQAGRRARQPYPGRRARYLDAGDRTPRPAHRGGGLAAAAHPHSFLETDSCDNDA